MRTLYALSIMLALSVPAFSQEVIVGDTARLPDPTADGWYECQYLGNEKVTTATLTPILGDDLGMMGIRFFTKSTHGLCPREFNRNESYVIWYLDLDTKADPLRYIEWYEVDLATDSVLVRGYRYMLDWTSGKAMPVFERKGIDNRMTRRASRR